ncbi:MULTISPECIES: LuxR family transcriptional regulator [Kitasatospora]|uniref:Putative LuxR family transcriptional regulator n=1 Tax=Kitasatospora setae (strain ATCC 33774 / DSM 43861 / JCM 3304 / KCC A-0304 / NBRC 14216 / KM-6054) TaxID=452652 RepID=E4N2D5_KITSK|nr:LuxR family transcriptional regulator [Kitasatospora setae]BAJ32319.1 putative LuxR family transcriptional regulator [Kitasatospora setae KM-6054]
MTPAERRPDSPAEATVLDATTLGATAESATTESATAAPIERGPHLARFARLLDDCRNGTGGVLAVTGPAGCGKTELLRALAAYAERHGAAVLTASGRCSERSARYGVLRQLLRAPRLPGPVRAAASALLNRSERDEAHPADPLAAGGVPSQVHQELWQLLAAGARRVPLVLAVDDLRHADPASQQVLAQLAARTPQGRVLLVATEPDPPSDPAADRDWWTALLRLPHLARLRVDRLSTAGTGLLLARLLPPAPAAGATGAASSASPASPASSASGSVDPGPWQRLTGGNPLLLRALAEDAAPGDPTPRPGSAFALAVRDCLHRAGPAAAEPARALAVLTASGSTALLPHLLDRPAPGPHPALEALAAAGLAVHDGGSAGGDGGAADRGWRLRGPAVARAVLDCLPDAERTARELRAAQLVYESGGAAEAVSGHLLAARDGSADWAGPVLKEAAHAALRRDDPVFAESCLALAAAAAPADAEVVLARALVRFRSDPRSAYRHLRALAHRPEQLTDGQRIDTLRSLPWHGTEDEIVRLATWPEPADAAGRDNLTRALEQIRAISPHLVPAGRPSPPPGLPVGEPQQRSALALPRVLRQGAAPDDLRTAELVLRTTPLEDSTFGSLVSALHVLLYADRAANAEPWCATLLREATARRIPVWQALLAGALAEIRWRTGDQRSAERLSVRALELLPPDGWGIWVGAPLSALLHSAAALGVRPDAERRLPVLPGRLTRSRYGAQFLYARGRHRLAAGQPDAALEDFGRCGRLLIDWGFDSPSFLPWRGDAARALMALERPQEARQLASAQLAHPAAGAPRTAGLSLRAMAAVEPDAAERVTLLTSAVDRLDGVDLTEHAWALAELGDAQSAAGDSRAGREALRRARELAESAGLRPLLERLRENAADTDEWGLSASERRVAALAAAGHSNREIAERLFITVSTVEQHLTHTYRKLRVKGRAELARSLQPGSGSGTGTGPGPSPGPGPERAGDRGGGERGGDRGGGGDRPAGRRAGVRPTGAQGAPRPSRSRRVPSA